MMKKLLFTASIALLLFSSVNAQVESIKNGVLWRDTEGNRIQAHGTDILKHDGRYYMIGEDRTTEFRSYQGINLYVSDDLRNWEFLNKLVDENTNEQMGNPNLPREERRFTERPNLIYNELTQKFVIWAKYQNPGFTANEVALFTSETIDGDYTFVKAFQPRGFDTNDCSFFRDDDGKVYFITTHNGVNTPNDPTDDGSLNLYELSDDYLDVKADPTFLLTGQNKEAPVIFKKDGLYYLLTSNKSGWTPNHGQYYTSTSLTSGWSGPKKYFNKLTYDSQPTDVITISDSAGNPSYYYVGDRWWDPRLPESKTIILPISVNSADATMRFQYVPEFKIDMSTGAWSAFDNNTYVPQDGWSVVSVSSEETTQTNNPATNAFDGDLSTIWHTRYSSGQDTQPHELVVDLGAE
ncbi:MAG: family 43 glycosylhydrolase, partial [Pricia sp.]